MYALPKKAVKQQKSHLRKGTGGQQTLDNKGPTDQDTDSGSSSDDTGDKGEMIFLECLHPKPAGENCLLQSNTCGKPVLVVSTKTGKKLGKIPVFEKGQMTIQMSCFKKGVKTELEEA